MKEVTSDKVRRILRKAGGAQSVVRTAVAALRRKTLPINILFSLGNELQSRGLMTRREFLRACKS
jgi:hypothetical protein